MRNLCRSAWIYMELHRFHIKPCGIYVNPCRSIQISRPCGNSPTCFIDIIRLRAYMKVIASTFWIGIHTQIMCFVRHNKGRKIQQTLPNGGEPFPKVLKNLHIHQNTSGKNRLFFRETKLGSRWWDTSRGDRLAAQATPLSYIYVLYMALRVRRARAREPRSIRDRGRIT